MGVPAKGEIWVDAGAVRAVRDARKSLFSAGITKVTALHSVCRHVEDACMSQPLVFYNQLLLHSAVLQYTNHALHRPCLLRKCCR